MGKLAAQARKATRRVIRETRLTEEEKTTLRSRAVYEGNPQHKRNPGDFGLTPPAAPRADKTLCDEAGIFKKARARELLMNAIERGVVSESDTTGFPKQMWVVDEHDRVFEAMIGGTQQGYYHGYPIRKSDPLHARILSILKDDDDVTG
jgi:hypothetical protein